MHEALVVFTDRRYFGWSIPDEYFRDRTINYLTYEQTAGRYAASAAGAQAVWRTGLPSCHLFRWAGVPGLLFCPMLEPRATAHVGFAGSHLIRSAGAACLYGLPRPIKLQAVQQPYCTALPRLSCTSQGIQHCSTLG